MALVSTANFPTYNILLLGETGVGKSTFINAFVNYLTFDDLLEAEKGELTFLISTKFTVTDDNFKPRTIHVGSNINTPVGASETQDPTDYVFNIGNAYIRLIDTPGIGDTRGSDQDTINFDKLLLHIGELNELHAICILLKPNEPRITVMFEYCIKQLLSRLEKSASQNIVFLFTNTRGTNYRPGETLTCLMELLEGIEKRPPYVKIPLSRDKIFCIDNESFRSLLVLKNGIHFNDAEKRSFIASWEQSSNECFRMITYISQLQPHKVQNTISINEARRLIIHLSQPLSDIAEMIQKNISVLQKKKDESQYCNNDVERLREQLKIPVEALQIEELTQPRTVCTAPSCCTVYEVNGQETYHHNKPCCEPCYLKYSSPTNTIVGAPELIYCQSMLSKTGSIPEIIKNGVRNFFYSLTNNTEQIYCTHCDCSYKLHKHIYYESHLVKTEIESETVKIQLKTKEDAKAAIEDFIQDIERRSAEYEEEQDIINKSTAKFAHFLQNNAITPYNDAYEYFLEYTIDREKSNWPLTDVNRIRMFEDMLRCYKEEKRTLDAALENARQTDMSKTSLITPQNVMETVSELYKLKYTGAKIKEMFDKQSRARRNEAQRQSEVKVETKRRSGIFNRIYNMFL
ncbi:hypothetical protein ILUMI_01936 [Ignelater luminosus]|uniref:DUF8206 domain-containing protein n=1 Tax=Ignelater luminosus TaxID=2038154 RepID=A0A8K0DPR3_IGNLU|nr:hypothetical protein ILUMI_01936 [Ignelater luminosus]